MLIDQKSELPVLTGAPHERKHRDPESWPNAANVVPAPRSDSYSSPYSSTSSRLDSRNTSVQSGAAQSSYTLPLERPLASPPPYEVQRNLQLEQSSGPSGGAQAGENSPFLQASYATSRAQVNAHPTVPSPTLPRGNDSEPGSSSKPSASTSPHETPSAFSRLPPQHLPYKTFSPMHLIANGEFLDEGFPLLAPPADSQPHPFATHDIREGDWIRWRKYIVMLLDVSR